MTTNNNNQIAMNDSAYYPSKAALSDFVNNMQAAPVREAIKSGFIARTDGFDVDEMVAHLETIPEQAGLLSRLLSVSDITEKTYDRFADNPNSMYNWLPAVGHALDNTKTDLKSPNTKTLRLPIELAQFIRLEYQNTSQHDKDLFNKFIFDQFELEDGKTYFIKTGNFSSKFQFANAKCYEPREMGEYFQVINNFAMQVGAGNSIDLVVREYIEDKEDNPTIYNGMPLRTEFRAFVDCDKDELIGVVPYWHPIVMKRALKHGLADSIKADYKTYLSHEQTLVDEYNQFLPKVRQEIQNILPNLDLKGKYSVDIMKNGDDLYVIDLALMSESALTELL